MAFFCTILDAVAPALTISDHLFQIFLPLPLIILVIMATFWLIKKLKEK